MTQETRRFLLAVMALATGFALLRRRPVKAPDPEGDWRPVGH